MRMLTKLLTKLLNNPGFGVRSALVCGPLLCLAGLGGCGGSGGNDAAPPAAAVQLKAPLAISAQPALQSVAAGQGATFSVRVTGGSAPTYQWTRNGAAIAGATAASYTTAAAALRDSGDVLRVTVRSASDTLVSDPALLLVEGVGTRILAGGGGDGTLARVDGVGKEARFQEAGSMALDSSGNLLLVEPTRRAIRKVTPTGVVTTWLDAPAQGSGLLYPQHIAVAGGAVFVTDGASPDSATALRQIAADGKVSTIAVAPDEGDPRDPGGLAYPARYTALAADAAGNVYIAGSVTRPGPASCSSCFTRTTVRRIAPDGKVSLLLASERAPRAPMDHVISLAADKGGNVFVLDAGNLVRIDNATGAATVLASNGDAYLNALAVDAAGILYVTGQSFSGVYSSWPANAIGSITPQGVLTVHANQRLDARFETAPNLLDSPVAIAVDAAGAIHVNMGSSIRKLVLP